MRYSTGDNNYHNHNTNQLAYRDDRQVVRYDSEPIHIKLGRVSHSSAMFVLKAFAAFVVVMLILLAIAYAVLSQGPISLTFMIKPMENSIQRELGNVRVKIDDTVIQKAENGFGIVFRVKGLRIINEEGATIAQAPSAAIGISIWGLLSGKIAASSVHFIDPELLLVESDNGEVGLAFSQKSSSHKRTRSISASSAGGNDQSLSNKLGKTLADVKAQQVDLVQTLYGLIKQARDGKASTSYLSSFGIRNAVVLLNSKNNQTQFNIPRVEISLKHKSNLSIISGRAKFTPQPGPYDVSFTTELHPNAQKISLLVKANNLAPSTLTNIFPNMGSLKAIRIPLKGTARFDLSQSGELLSAESDFTLGSGVLHVSPQEKRDMQIDKGRIKLSYDRKQGKIKVHKSSLHWGGSHAVFSGGIQYGRDSKGIRYWRYLLQTEDAAIETREFGIERRKIDNWSASGYLIPDQKRIHLEQLLIQSGNSFLDFSGDIIDAPGSPEVLLTGKISPMKLSLFKQLWPRFAAPGAREWIGKRVSKGYVTGGRLRMAIGKGMLQKLSSGTGDIGQNAFSFEMGISNFEATYVKGLLPIKVKSAVARFSGRKFVLTIPQGHVDLPSGKKINMTGTFNIDDLRKETQVGEISFRTEADAKTLMEFLDQPGLEYLKQAKFDPATITGYTKSQMKMKMPLVKNLKFSDMKIDGKVVLQKATFPKTPKELDVGNGTITFGVTEQAINAKGRVYVNGVPANLSWHRIFKGSPDKQPGIRVDIRLNSEKLNRLGLPVGNFIKGDVPTSVVSRRTSDGNDRIKIQADLTNAELIFSRLGWTKPPGKRAILEMDVLKRPDSGAADIKNFKIVGDDITIDGDMSLGEDGKLKSFVFRNFNVNVLTNLKFEGTRDKKRGWKISVKGPTYDGRQFFRDIFSTAKLNQNLQGEVDKSDVSISVSINTVLGFGNTKVNNVRVYIQQREGRLTVFEARGDVDNGRLLAKLQYADNEARVLRAETDNAGYAFKLIGYPNIVGGDAALEVNLDAAKGTKQSGTLWTRNFAILGDEVVKEVLSSDTSGSSDDLAARRRKRLHPNREHVLFDEMQVKFSTGQGLFELKKSFIKGPSLAVFLKGVIDFEKRRINLAGTYSPIYGISRLFAAFPLVGEKGLLSITFAVRGKLDRPEVTVNPASIAAPGVFNELFEGNTSNDTQNRLKESDLFPSN